MTLINRNATIFYRTKNRKYVTGHGFLSFVRKYRKQLLATGLNAVKTTSKKVVHKAGEFLGNKTTDAVAKSNKNPINVEEITIPL